MNSGKRILMVSANADLGVSRALVLRDAGHEVTLAADRMGGERVLAGGAFDVLVLCQTVASADCLALTEAFRNLNRDGKVVAVVSGLFLVIRADKVVQSLDGPHALLQAIDSLGNGKRLAV
jgi:DNA-binding response OmpR family regulator